ncbi:MAG: ATP-binding protein [Candidatus Hadarchaeum sp.]|uniref:ATP-binding protein n=1 Tax=Candidatus Hadarchaeum sp. TaxID=2883567 RepID=UPI003D0A7AC6
MPISDVLEISNEWWWKESISEEKAKPYRRRIFQELKKHMGSRQMLILTGLRRVGKSTLMYQLMEELMKGGVDPKKILYFSFDEAVKEPISVLREYQKLTQVRWKEENVFVFFDEVHKLRNWSSKLKLLYDALPNLKIVLSGSASIMIEKEALTNLAGRYVQREVKPLSLGEFAELSLGRRIENLEMWRNELEALLPMYLKRPFPEIVSWEDELKVREYIRELVIEKTVKVDMPDIFSRVRTGLLLTLLENFMSEPGMVLNLSSLSRDLRIHKLTLEEHLFFLEFAKLIRVVKNFRPSVRAESRKMKKIYPAHIALSFPFYTSPGKGEIFETLVASSMDLKNYWRKNSKEVDFVRKDGEMVPVEVKAGPEVRKDELKNLVYFMKKYGAERGLLIYGGHERKSVKVNSKIVDVVPIVDVIF